MAAPQLRTREDADQLFQMLQSGQVAPDKVEEAEDQLHRFMLAEQAQQKRMEQAEQLNALIDHSPRQGPGTLGRDTGGGPLGLTPADRAIMRGEEPLGTPENPDRAYLLNAAAEQGLDVHTGLPASDRGKAALLNFDPNMQMAAVEHMIRQQHKAAGISLPADVPLTFTDETSGEAYYLRPEGGKLVKTLINPAGIDSGDFLEIVPDAFSFTGEVGGAIAGGAVGGTTGSGVGVATGGAAGAAVGLFATYEARRKAAKMFGLPEEIADNAEIPFSDLAFAGGGELGGAAIMGAIRKFKNLGRPLQESDLPELRKEWEKNLRKVREVERAAGDGVVLTPTIGELTGNEKLLVLEAELRSSAKDSASRTLREKDIRDRVNAGKAFRQMADSEGIRTPMDELAPVERVSQDAKDTLRRPAEAVKQQQDRLRVEVDELDQSIDRSPDLQVFVDVRDGTAAAARQAKERSDAAWDAYRREVGFDPQTRRSEFKLSNPNDSPIRSYMQGVEGDRQQAMLRSLEQAQEAFLRDAGFGPKDIGAEQLTGLAQRTLDMRHLHFTLSHLKRQLRAAGRQVDPNAMRSEDIRGLIGAIEEQIQSTPIVHRSGQAVSAEKQARIRLAWDDANSATFRMHEQYDTKNMQDILETAKRRNPETGQVEDVLVMNPLAVRGAMFRAGDTRFMEEALEAIGHNPTAKAALGRQLLKKYRDDVFVDGVPQQTRHNEFIEKYQDHMNILLGEDSAAKITNAGSFARQMDEYSASVRRLEDTLQKEYGRRVTNPASNINIAEEILSKRVSPKQARNIVDALDDFDPALGDQARGHILDTMYHKAFGKNDIISSTSLGNMLRNNAATIDAVFGRRYRKNLETLNDVVKIIDRRSLASAPAKDTQQWWLQVLRSTWGPLSKKQRFTTAVNRATRRLAGKRASEIMQDPDNLDAFIRLKNMTPSDPRFLGLVTFLGLAEAVDEDTMSTARRAAETRRTLSEEFPLQGAGSVL